MMGTVINFPKNKYFDKVKSVSVECTNHKWHNASDFPLCYSEPLLYL